MSDVREFPMRPPAATPAAPPSMAAMETSEVDAFAMRLFLSDRNLGRIAADTPFTHVDHRAPISSDQRRSIRERAALAVRLGNPVRKSVAIEKGAQTIIQAITDGISSGRIAADSPLVALDLTAARKLAKVAIDGALEYLTSDAQVEVKV